MNEMNFKFLRGELRYNADPIDKTTFEIGQIKKNKKGKLVKLMMTRDNEKEIPLEDRKWEVHKIKVMVMRHSRGPNIGTTNINMEYVETKKPYFITAEQHKNPLWNDEDETNYERELLNDTSLVERRKGYHPNLLHYDP